MTLYCGIDLHSNNSVVAVLDEQDRTVYEKRLPNDLETITEVCASINRSWLLAWWSPRITGTGWWMD